MIMYPSKCVLQIKRNWNYIAVNVSCDTSQPKIGPFSSHPTIADTKDGLEGVRYNES